MGTLIKARTDQRTKAYDGLGYSKCFFSLITIASFIESNVTVSNVAKKQGCSLDLECLGLETFSTSRSRLGLEAERLVRKLI